MSLELFNHLYISGTSAQTIVLLHGTGGDKEGMAKLGHQIAPEAAILALDGQVVQDDMRRFFKREAIGYYDMIDLEARTLDLTRFVDAAFDYYTIDDQKTIGLGYSNGANILTNLILKGACRMPSNVIMHPLIPFMVEDWPDLSAHSLLITAAEHDPVCPAPWTHKLADGLKEAGAKVTLRMHNGGHDLSDTEVASAKMYMIDHEPFAASRSA